ncbi:hypothetical protein BABINDRAFT_131701 [Babjeviella inositovora NRRL Y-12698]|uniref:Uncharacterized protein n=1 Tax=Babjeviella inositovora NRRL Y-12698 TaxID=984486 RepID=A0A1E3QRI3_9ASCO|nr:uncharacterized protein BABINDRAFT_131701 [Babjeviella inositovora NRRL Y-12698]ODQ80305.1 hypothetical protein BABINDRAFT_131701 [Babjeviella inositovora NRRL Y-12698]
MKTKPQVKPQVKPSLSKKPAKVGISKKTALKRLKSKLSKSKNQSLTLRLNADADVNDIMVASNATKFAMLPGVSAFKKDDLDKSLVSDVATTKKSKDADDDLTKQLEMISGFNL